MDVGERKKAYTRGWRSKNRDKVRAWRRRSYLKNRDRDRAKQRLWWLANPDKVRVYKRKAAYGITQPEYESLLTRQKNVCAGCGRPFGSTTPHIDHCHSTGVIRGILHTGCNMALGHINDDPEVLEGLARYLRRG